MAIRVIVNGSTVTPPSVASVNGETGEVELDHSDVGAASSAELAAVESDVADLESDVADLQASPGGTDYILIRDEKASGTAGGTFTLGAWRTRDLNTEVVDTGGHASVASNQITLAAGTYRIRASCPAYGVNANQAKLYNVTDAADILLGTTAYAYNTAGGQDTSFIVGRFTLTGTKVLEIRHQGEATMATFGFGGASSFGGNIYTVVELERER